MFKDIKDGESIYILDIEPKSGMPTYHEGVLQSKSAITSKVGTLLSTEYEFNLIISVTEGVVKEFCEVNPDGDYAVSGRYRLSTDKSKLVSEIQRIYDEKSIHVTNHELYKSIITKCEQLMGEIGIENSNYDWRMRQLESKYDTITSSLKTIMEHLAKQSTNS